MSGIILSAAVRQNLLSLQDTATLTATTQQRLATGKKVNSALDNPSAFFTSQALSSRAGRPPERPQSDRPGGADHQRRQ